MADNNQSLGRTLDKLNPLDSGFVPQELPTFSTQQHDIGEHDHLSSLVCIYFFISKIFTVTYFSHVLLH